MAFNPFANLKKEVLQGNIPKEDPERIMLSGSWFLDERRKILVNKMTNWQRNQWARSGYPAKRVEEFSRMKRHGT